LVSAPHRGVLVKRPVAVAPDYDHAQHSDSVGPQDAFSK